MDTQSEDAENDVATPATTRAEFMRVSARGYTVIRNIFVQVKRGDKWVGSSLGRLVQARQPRALRAYLLLLMSWSALDKRSEPLEAAIWARGLSPDPPAPAWPASAMTRVWKELVAHGLVERQRQARLVKLAPRREDGRAPYARPRPDESKSRRERFFILPDAFWAEGWHERLTMPGIAALLILLAETTGRDEVVLPYDRAPGWYGISAKTLQNGLEDLRKNGLVCERRVWVRSDFSRSERRRRSTTALRVISAELPVGRCRRSPQPPRERGLASKAPPRPRRDEPTQPPRRSDMATQLEPYCDQRTIRSFKRTFNAAVLLMAARGRARRGSPRGRKTGALVLFLYATHLAWPQLAHALHWIGT